MTTHVYAGGRIFDGATLHSGAALCISNGRATYLGPVSDAPDGPAVDLEGDILAPGFVDLQVNGGGGVMLGDAPTPQTLATIYAAHKAAGCAAILPTLITDTPQNTAAVLAAAQEACADGQEGILGLHLEGPHLAAAKKGAHDAARIRAMTDEDLELLLRARDRLPILKVTLAPESATLDQVRRLAAAGVLVSLGHSNTDYDTALAYAEAGARCATHLFNAMSPMESRAPGLVGAALDCGALSAGLIADGTHVHPATLAAAIRAKQGPAEVFLVSDAMAPAGTDARQFLLGGRKILREGGRLQLQDGTLAGADLDLLSAVRCLHTRCGVSLEASLRAATGAPVRLVSAPDGLGHLKVGEPARALRLKKDLSAAQVLF